MIHVSNIGEIIDIQCKKDVKKVELSYFLFGGERETKPLPQPPPPRGGGGGGGGHRRGGRGVVGGYLFCLY